MRKAIYYWKSDRPSALPGAVPADRVEAAAFLPALRERCVAIFGEPLTLIPAGGAGNHHTYRLESPQGAMFVRLESGPEGDGQLAMESRLLEALSRKGVAVPRVFFTDATRERSPFAFQVIEFFPCPDLHRLHCEGQLDLKAVAGKIGRAIADWQKVPVEGFGPLDPAVPDVFRGYHERYGAYFHLNLERHLGHLEAAGFLSAREGERVRRVIGANAALLEIGDGVLVHKDLALWNMMGTPGEIHAFIDWDDAIAGDPCDDLSLLACFHPPEVVASAVAGYREVAPLPEPFGPRFQLHLLRNLIVKAVIRCAGGYFERPAGGVFLMEPGQDGAALRKWTRERLFAAVQALEGYSK